jgi:hypothetical protein
MPRGEKLKEVHAIAKQIWKQGREPYTQAVKRAWEELEKKGVKPKPKANAAQ